MFSLEAFIRQLLPPNKRTDLNVAFIRMLLAPVVFVLNLIEATRITLLIEARATGQVLILQELCNRTAYNSAVGPIYLLEGNYSSIDFQVVVPEGLSASTISNLKGVLDRHKLAGKRYAIREQAIYDPETQVVSWESGYPYITETYIAWAINKTGSFQTLMVIDGVEVINQPMNYVAGQSIQWANTDGTNVTITVSTVSASLTRDVDAPAIDRIGFMKFGVLLFILPNVDLGDVEVKLVGVNGTTYTDSYQTAEVANNTVSGVSYNRQRIYVNVPDGQYTAYARVKGQTVEFTQNLSFGTANQLPIVSYENPNQTGKVGVFFSYQIPLNTFTDPDGPQPSISVSGYPSPLSYNSSTRTISGTPTATGTHTITVTGTDNQGATVQDIFTLTINPADTIDPPPTTGSSSIVMYNSNIFKPVVQFNSEGKARIIDDSGFTPPGGMNVYYYRSGGLLETSLSTDYEYSPGQTVTIWKQVAAGPEWWIYSIYAKGFSIIYIGQPS